jgi:monoamine oxidase
MSKQSNDIIIIGAGIAGLMAAGELSKAGKKVLVLEARDRIGGRILPLSEKEFGYPAQGGAEWVHGAAPITKALVKEAGLTLIPEDGEIWSLRDGKLLVHKAFIQDNDNLKAKLEALTEDVSIWDFLEQNFNEDKNKHFKNSILKMVEGYDAADPKKISTFTLRHEWLAHPRMTQIMDDHRIKEGYGALVNFLEKECKKSGTTFHLSSIVKKIKLDEQGVSVFTEDEEFKAQKVIVTIPLPLLKEIDFGPELKEKIALADKIGFGNALKVLIKFKTRWWEHATENDLTKMSFLLGNEKFLTWWTQYPEINTVLTGWMAGPEAANHKNATHEELLDTALTSLSRMFGIDKNKIADEVVSSKSVNWPGEPFSKGAYSYTMVETKDAYEKLVESVQNKLFFAGEALYSGEITATVEGALGSGKETAERILNK